MAATLTATLSVLLVTRLVFTCCAQASGGQLEVFPEPVIQSECRDRHLWIHVSSLQPPQFEAVDGNGVHTLSTDLAARCGYTISTFKTDGFTTLRASYYSCFTQNQRDEVFSFRLNVILTDPHGRWTSHPVSGVCSAPSWTHREMVCEEDYMEVNVNRESSCGSHQGDVEATQQAAFTTAQRRASSAGQLMFQQGEDEVVSMSISEAHRLGYSLTTTATRVVLRSPYKQPHTKVIMVDGVEVEVVQVWLFFKQRLMVVMLDVSMACTVNSGFFDGPWLLWDIPRVMTPLVGEGVGFESRSISVGVEGRLLDEPTATSRGITVAQQKGRVQIRVPYGVEGGYRKSLVVNNVYKEMYMIFLLYEHIFAQVYEDGTSVETRQRLLRLLNTPLTSQQPTTVDQTDELAFRVYLGNIPVDVFLEKVSINGKKLDVSDGSEQGYSVKPVLHANGSRAYELRVPFQDAVVHRTYLGEGVLQYSLDINFTLTIMRQGESYYHQAYITAYVHNAFPPQITSECSHGGITFTVMRTPIAESLWEVGVGPEALTSQLAALNGYRLHHDKHKSVLEVPVFSPGYTYEEINLVSFYGTFKLLLRDSRTLEVQTSTAKRCIFKTQDMIVCSTDGIMTAVTTLSTTWPTVQPDRTTLLDPTCGPKQTDGAKVLFEFKLNTCGTRAMVGESYVVYENEILHDRQLIADGPNVISRDSKYRLTVRCFYPLAAVSRLFVDRIFRSEKQGVGSIKVFESIEGTTNAHPVYGIHPAPSLDHNTAGTQPKPKPGHFTTGGNHVPASYQSSVLQTVLNPNLPPQQHGLRTEHVPLQIPAVPGQLVSQKRDQNVFSWHPLSVFPDEYNQLPDGSIQPGPSNNNPTSGLGSFSGIPNSPGRLSESSWKAAQQGPDLTLQGLDSLGNTVWYSGLKRDQNSVQPNLDLQEARREIHLHPGTYEQSHRREAEPAHPHKPAAQRDVKYIFTDQKHSNVTADLYEDPVANLRSSQPVGTRPAYETSQVDQNQGGGSIQKDKRPQNIRVRPPKKLAPSGYALHQPSGSYMSSQSITAPPAVSSDESQNPDHRSSDGREIRHVRVKPGQSAARFLAKKPATRFESSRMSDLSFTPPNVPKDGEPDRTNHRVPGVNSPHTLSQDLTGASANPRMFLRSNTASGGSGSVQHVQHQAECSRSPGSVSAQYGASVHQGILRGPQMD